MDERAGLSEGDGRVLTLTLKRIAMRVSVSPRATM